MNTYGTGDIAPNNGGYVRTLPSTAATPGDHLTSTKEVGMATPMQVHLARAS
jgi:hypothetical protein